MNNHAPRGILKIDATSIQTRLNNQNAFVIIYNINVPQHIVNQPNEFLTTLQDIKNLVAGDFGGGHVLFQITASYLLEHTETGQLRTWTGSFFVKNNSLAQVSSFIVFNANNFVRTSSLEIASLTQKLTLQNGNTKWKFNRLLSVIFNIQSTVDPTNRLLTTRNLKNPRRHRTFQFP
jgi:hypothetical protein